MFVQLPLQSCPAGGQPPLIDFRPLWNRLGVTFPFVGSEFLNRARLPEGWTIQKLFGPDFFQRKFLVLDAEATPRVSVVVQRTLPQCARKQRATVEEIPPDRAAHIRENTLRETDVEREFDRLHENYHNAWTSHLGRGTAANAAIARERLPLTLFLADHPQFAWRVPQPRSMYDDGTKGVHTGDMMLREELSV